MNIPRIVRGNADKALFSVRNMANTGVASPTDLVNGDVVALMVTGDTFVTGYTLKPGIDVKVCGAVEPTVCGVMVKTVPFAEYGQCQCYGYHSSVKTTAAALAVDTVVTAGAAGAAVVRAAAAVGDIDDQELGVCIVTGVANRAGIFIKCM